MKWRLLFLLIFVIRISSAQNEDPDRKLDGILRHAAIGKPFIIRIDNSIRIDSINVIRVKFNSKDSTITLKLRNNTEKTYASENFWGYVSEYGEQVRCYDRGSFVLWKTTSPYIYEQKKGNYSVFYFSETLTGAIYPLTSYHIDTYASNIDVKELLYYNAKNDYIVSHIYKGSHKGGMSENTKEVTVALVDIFLNILTSRFIYDVINLLD